MLQQRVARELSPGNVVIMRHSVGGKLQLRASFQRRDDTTSFFEATELRDADTAIFEGENDPTPDARLTDETSLSSLSYPLKDMLKKLMRNKCKRGVFF